MVLDPVLWLVGIATEGISEVLAEFPEKPDFSKLKVLIEIKIPHVRRGSE